MIIPNGHYHGEASINTGSILCWLRIRSTSRTTLHGIVFAFVKSSAHLRLRPPPQVSYSCLLFIAHNQGHKYSWNSFAYERSSVCYCRNNTLMMCNTQACNDVRWPLRTCVRYSVTTRKLQNRTAPLLSVILRFTLQGCVLGFLHVPVILLRVILRLQKGKYWRISEHVEKSEDIYCR